jgi:hypothetical protein
MFTDEREAQLAEEIRVEYLSKGYIFTDADFRLMAIEAYYRWNPINADDEVPSYKQFMASNGFTHLFKKRNRFSSRRLHFKRRSRSNPELEQRFVAEITDLINSAEPDSVLNCDETSWKLYPNGILTWADTGSQNVAIATNGNEKDALTVMATVSLAAQKLPLYILAKGETVRCEMTQLGDIGNHASDHTSSGWMTTPTMIRYLGWLREFLDSRDGQGRIYHLLMDIYPVHVMEPVRLQARLLGFNVHFIPSGQTDKYQPLDRSVFGCLKSTARAEYLKLVRDDPSRRITKEVAVQMLQRAWDELSVIALEAAWAIYQEGNQNARRRADDRSAQGPSRRRKAASIGEKKRQVFSRYEGAVIAALLALATEEKPFVAMRRIVAFAHDVEKEPNLVGIRRTMKNILRMLTDQKVLKVKKDSYALTKRGAALVCADRKEMAAG